MRLISYCGLILLFLIATGCCSLVSKSGDAKVYRCPQLIHERGTKFYKMELPDISLAQNGTQVLKIRNLPPYLSGLFNYDMSMVWDEQGKDPSSYSERTEPWFNAKISIAFRDLDGANIFKQEYSLGTSAHGFTQSHDGWLVDWNLDHLDPVPIKDDSFDIVVVVEEPSKKASDKINISAWAICPKPL
jgi:hypothetical protein